MYFYTARRGGYAVLWLPNPLQPRLSVLSCFMKALILITLIALIILLKDTVIMRDESLITLIILIALIALTNGSLITLHEGGCILLDN